MKQFLYKLEFYFDYYFGYFMYSDGGHTDKWQKYMEDKYPEYFKN